MLATTGDDDFNYQKRHAFAFNFNWTSSFSLRLLCVKKISLGNHSHICVMRVAIVMPHSSNYETKPSELKKIESETIISESTCSMMN